MKKLNTYTLTISKKNNSYVWLPAKTASNTLSWILAHFDFDKYIFDENNNLSIETDLTHFGHSTAHPDNSDKMLFISSIRNPYERYFSFFKMFNKFNKANITKTNFEKFIHEEFEKKNSVLYKSFDIFKERKPNFIIRTENLYIDLIKIPFIKNSKLHECGILEEMCQKKIWSSYDINSQEYYTFETKEMVYNLFQDYFELGGYEK